MAKSPNFFGLRRGSTKSLTFQIYRGQQITKDRVFSVSNPQSTNQMKQRLLIPMVAQTRAQLKTLVDHSFEGINYGEESLKRFSSLNMAKGGLTTILQYVPKGIVNSGLADYIVSEGSLTPLTYGSEDYVSGSTFLCEDYTLFNVFLPQAKVFGDTAISDSVLTTDIIDKMVAANNGVLQRGDQLTFLTLYQGEEFSYDVAVDTQKTGHYTRYFISRLIFDETQENSWKLTTDVDKNVVTLTDGYTILEGSSDHLYMYNARPGATMRNLAGGKIVGFCVILSRQVDDVWLRSPQRIVLAGEDVEISESDAKYSYLKSSSASAKYLNTGIEGVTITGGNS